MRMALQESCCSLCIEITAGIRSNWQKRECIPVDETMIVSQWVPFFIPVYYKQ